jgi:hypothetical protein
MVTSTGQILGAGNATAFKNRIINGGMVIDQRGSASSPVATGVGVDRFLYGNNGAGVVTFGQSTTAPAGFINSSVVTVTTADSSIANSDLYYIYQQIEGLNVADLGFGTASAQTVTLSFWVRSSVIGTYGAVITNSSGNRSYVSNYTINVANTWEQKLVTVAGDTSGTWLTTNGIGLSIRWGLAAGSNWQGTAGVWGTANAVCSSSQVNFMATVSNTFYLTGVQLEVGSQATSFDFRDYGRELILCQRYFQRVGPNNGYQEHYALGPCRPAEINTLYAYKVTMRSAPSVTVNDYTLLNVFNGAGITATCVGYVESYISPTTCLLGISVPSGSFTAGTSGYVYLANGATISFSSEL